MKLKHFVWWGALFVCVLVLAAWTAWLSGQHYFQPMPKSLTTPPDVDRSHIPLGPYTANFSGLIGGPTGDKHVTFYVVMRPSGVHLQHAEEVGKSLEGASVIGLGITYLTAKPQLAPVKHGSQIVDGLILVPSTLDTYPEFLTLSRMDAIGRPLHVTCYLGEKQRAMITKLLSFHGVNSGMCTATFWLAPDIFATLDGVQPPMFPSMAQFLPELYKIVSNRIHGEP